MTFYCCAVNANGSDPVYMSRKIRKFRTDTFLRETTHVTHVNGRLPARVRTCVKFPSVSRAEFIRSELSNFSAHVSVNSV